MTREGLQSAARSGRLHAASVLLSIAIGAPAAMGSPWFGEPIVSDSRRDLGFSRVADLNGDGILDLVSQTTGAPFEYRIHLMDAAGHATLVDSIASVKLSGDRFTFVDENRDSFPDIIGRAPDSWEWLYRNDGTGRFEPVNRYEIGGMQTVADVDRDGYEDLAAPDLWASGVKIIPGTQVGLNWEHSIFIDLSEYEYPWEQLFISDIAFLDLDNDSNLDCLIVGKVWNEFDEPDHCTIRWAFGLGGWSFSEPHFQRAAEVPCDLFSANVADLDDDGDPDLVCSKYHMDAIFFYDHIADQFIEGGDPFREQGIWLEVQLAMIDEDAIPDALVSSDICGAELCSMAYKGLGSGAFAPCQQLDEAGNGTFGRIFGNLGLDFVSVCPSGTGDRPIAVWPNLAIPADIEEDDASVTMRGHINAFPSVSADIVRLTADSPIGANAVFEVLDPEGRLIREVPSTGAETLWDLRDNEGRPVRSGVYWVRLKDASVHGSSMRVIVCR